MNSEKETDTASLGPLLLGALALSLTMAGTSLMNGAVFPRFDAIFTFGRDISVTAAALAFIVLGAIAWRAPQLLTPRSYAAVTGTTLVVGAVATAVGLGLSSAPLLVAGSCLFCVGRSGVSLLVGLMLSTLPTAQAASAICIGCFAQFFIAGLPFGQTVVELAAFFAFPFIAALLAFPRGHGVLSRAASSESSRSWSITRPTSFLAPFSALFICLFLFHVAFGFSLRFDEVAGMPRSTVVSALPALIACVIVIGFKRRFPADICVQISGLIIIAGFLLASTGQLGYTRSAVTLLNAGNALFDLTSELALVAIASRNLLGAATVIAWGHGASSFGSLAGAAAAMVANHSTLSDHSLVFPIAAVLLLLFATYLVVGMKGFSFQEAIDGIEPLDPEAVAQSPQDQFNERCEAIAAEHGLTPREAEVFAMLARGRNGDYIQEALVVSRNTVKAHVKHVYAKLDVHSHQELIDLVEGC